MKELDKLEESGPATESEDSDEAIDVMEESGEPVGDMPIIVAKLRPYASIFVEVGGIATWIAKTLTTSGSATHATEYATLVRSAAQFRQIKATAFDLRQKVSEETDPIQLVQWAIACPIW